MEALSMTSDVKCPVCRGDGGTRASTFVNDTGNQSFNCERCGLFSISDTALEDKLLERGPWGQPIPHAALSHRIRIAHDSNKQILLKSKFLEDFGQSPQLPTPADQADNLIFVVGDSKIRTGNDFHLDHAAVAKIGALNLKHAQRLCDELIERGLIIKRGEPRIDRPGGGTINIRTLDLTLTGWEKYETLAHGQRKGSYGFLALKFDTNDLDPFVKEVLKPTIKAELGFDVVDMRDVGSAGIIDNLMRAQIRDSAFVIADLTHENSGAYWEAGYAEGLGKPVIYMCEKAKFEIARTHFDTNHSTTILWSSDDPEAFSKDMVATIRRSLSLF
tara:strand:+ start:1342 stop:2334 length:993 start_codon:yes stop_codon:yes gene_type:complete